MQLSDIPGKLVLPFANAGGKSTIPVASQIGVTAGAASLTDGFPPLTRTPIAAGGVPPSGLDMNGILYEMSAIIRWTNAGGGYPFDGTFAADTNVGGYPKGARIMRSDGTGYWFNTAENNVTDPESAGAAAAGWVPDFTTGVAAVAMASANVTLTPAQYGKRVIVVTGTLTANLNLIFPTITGAWVVINRTVGGFSITAKTTSGTGVVVLFGVGQIYGDAVNIYSADFDFLCPERFGAVGDGVADDTAAIRAYFAASNHVEFPYPKTYLMTGGVTKTGNDIYVNFGDAKFINSGVGFLFTFGTTANTPSYKGLTILGGHFTQLDPATTNNQNYIHVSSIKDFSIRDCILDNISNGGIAVDAGSEDGLIDGVKINGRSNYGTCRGIWLQGNTATDFSDVFVDTTSITRNATPFPVYAVKNVKISHCTILVPNYGVYLMNARDCSIEDNYIDASGVGSTRCIAVNVYSPNTKVRGNTLISDRSCTGILVTQCSDNVLITDNTFKGSFGGNRDIYVAYLADAVIMNNRFNTDTTQNIQIDMGGFAVIKNNEFNKAARTADYRAVYLNTIDPTVAGTTVGNTATILPGIVFHNNILRRRCLGVAADATLTSLSGNQPGFEMLDIKDNVFFNMDLAATGSEYPLLLTTGAGANVTRFRYIGNVVLPNTAAARNFANAASGTAFYSEATQAGVARFFVNVAAAGGAITVTKNAGENFSISVTRTGANLILSPRTIAGAAGASVAVPFGLVDDSGTIYRFACVKSTTNWILSAFDSAGVAINLATAAAAFSVIVGAASNT